MATSISKEAFIKACNSLKTQARLRREREQAEAERQRQERLRREREQAEANKPDYGGGYNIDIPLFDLDAVRGNTVSSPSRSNNMPDEIYRRTAPTTSRTRGRTNQTVSVERNIRFTGDAGDVDLLNLRVN